VTAFLAQVPGQAQAEESLSTIAQQGLLGSMLVLSLVAAFVAIRGWLKAKDDRFGDQKQMTEALLKVNEGARDLTIEIKEAVTNLVSEVRRSNDATKASVDNLEKEQTELRGTIMSLKDTQLQTGTALNALTQEVARQGRPG